MKIPAALDRLLRPAFVRRFDQRLLKNSPDIWRLQVHWVAAYALFAGLVLFAAGYLMPMEFYGFGNEPTGYLTERIQLVSGAIGLISVLMYFVWRNKLSHFSGKHVKWQFTLIEIFIYFCCNVLVFFAISAYGRGVSLKKIHFGRECQKISRDYLEPNNFFFPTYLPHFFRDERTNREQYFRQGEELAGMFLKKANSVGGNLSLEGYSRESADWMLMLPQEIECMSARFSPDSVRRGMGHFEKDRNYDFYKKEIGVYGQAPPFPLFFAGLDYAESKTVLETEPDELLDTMQFRFRSADDEEVVFYKNMSFPKPGTSRIISERNLTDSTAEVRFHYFGHNLANAQKSFLMRVFSLKCFLESLDTRERAGYWDYLDKISEMAEPTSLVFEYETIVPNMNNQVYEKKEPFIRDERYSLGARKFKEEADLDTLEMLNVTFENLRPSLDTLSKFWYRNYLEHSRNWNSECPFNDGDCLGKLLSADPKPLDSLLIYDFFSRKKYYFAQSFYHTDRYLDHYFKKQTPARLDSLRHFLHSSGYPMEKILDDPSGRTLLLAASGMYWRSTDINGFLECHRNCWCKPGDEAAMIGCLALYLGIFMFFLANITTTAMLRNFVVIGILFWLLSNFQIGSGMSNGLNISLVLMVFVAGLPAMATILFLAKSRKRSKYANSMAQFQVAISFYAITSNQHRLFGLAQSDFPHLGLGLFLYWSSLLVTIAVLFRRHISLPEK